MKVRITDIGPNGLKVNNTIALERLNARLNESNSNDIKFTKDPEIDLLVNRTPTGAEVKGTTKAKFIQPCALCIEEQEREIELKINYIFQRKSDMQLANNDDPNNHYFDDVGLCYFSGDHIELEDIIQETLILSMDPYWKPERTPENKCTACGKECSKVMSFG